ncbi:hypothetical protein [Saccharolobus shibatae]|uniref:Uncharacterized protein n=1 Tax=Saccharolobus shibatae TaxID=2286 RepID=A0A8F5C219_9CREN|nr:hypothetical protein [Saccharolobus shibatae]QXJ35530.1 hypothetical protein J5U22_02077 [Saccharolobus shibatae]
MSEVSASGFTGAFTIRTFSELDLYAVAGRLVGLGYEVAQIKLSGNTGYVYIPINENGAFAKKNYADVYYQPRTFTVVSEEFGNFQLASGELVRVLSESGLSNINYAELNVNFERTLPCVNATYNSWDIRGFSFSRGELDSKNYEQVSISRINDKLCRYLITIYDRGDYENIAREISMLKSKMDSITDFLLEGYKLLNNKFLSNKENNM